MEGDMFAFFNLGPVEVIVLGGCGFVVATGVVLAIVLPIALRPKRRIEPDDRATPLERAQDAAAVLTPEEREALRRSLEEKRGPQPPSGGEGIQ
jgi:uncharacterized membrane protein